MIYGFWTAAENAVAAKASAVVRRLTKTMAGEGEENRSWRIASAFNITLFLWN